MENLNISIYFVLGQRS